MIETAHRLIAWFERNERHIATPIFIAGFLNDVLTLRLVSVQYAVLLFGAYAVVAFFSTIGAHYLYIHPDNKGEEHWTRTTLRILLNFLAQFLTGGLVSGCLIFYTKSAALSASWPFIFLLAAIFIGNEVFKKSREELAFHSVLYFFTVYAYAIFALPTVLHTINALTFVESSAAAIGVFVLFLIGLLLAGYRRAWSSMREIAIGALIVLAIVNASYFTGIIPPLPLTLQEVGVYESISHEMVNGTSEYVVTSEPESYAWWDVFKREPAHVKYVPGTSLSVFSAVFAPIAFTTPVVHVWQWYDPKALSWKTQAEIAFPIEGGRDGGYRGYSTLTDLKQGKYRVSIETISGQVIGRTYFNVQYVNSEPPLITEVK